MLPGLGIRDQFAGSSDRDLVTTSVTEAFMEYLDVEGVHTFLSK